MRTFFSAMLTSLALGACASRSPSVELPKTPSPAPEFPTLAGGGGGGGTGRASGSGNGGSEVRDDSYIPLGEKVLAFLTEDPLGMKLAEHFSLPVDRMGAGFGQALNRNSIEVSYEQVYDDSGSPVDAAFLGGKTRLYDTAWRNFLTQGRKMYRMVFHEMLRFVKVDDDGFRISRAILNDTDDVTFNSDFEVKLVTEEDLRDPLTLGRAALAGQQSFVEALLAAGADVGVHPEDNEWPVRYEPLLAAVTYANEYYRWASAKKHRSAKAEAIVKVLLDHGARCWNTTDVFVILEEPSLSVETTERLLRTWARHAPRPIVHDQLVNLVHWQFSRPQSEVEKLVSVIDKLNSVR